MLRCICFDKEKEHIKSFLRLPKKLYAKDCNMENPKEVRRFLQGTHPLSKYFELHKFIIYRNTNVVGRFALTAYPGEEVIYLGFFECVDDAEVSKFLFQEAFSYAKQLGFSKMIGPVDASFWNTYRLKINLFDGKPYTGEPYNLSYYLKLFEESGFEVCEHYTSNIYNKVDAAEPLYDRRYAAFTEKGYRIASPSMKEFDAVVKELYRLITELYSDFPVYQAVKEEDFATIFSDYRYILNPDMVKMAYYKEQAVGFFVSVPNYGNRVYHLNHLGNLLRVFATKKNPKSYVMLYMGVDQSHRGLGKALVGSIMEELRKSGLPSIGALARDGKVTQKYGEEHIENQYEYVLLEKYL